MALGFYKENWYLFSRDYLTNIWIIQSDAASEDFLWCCVVDLYLLSIPFCPYYLFEAGFDLRMALKKADTNPDVYRFEPSERMKQTLSEDYCLHPAESDHGFIVVANLNHMLPYSIFRTDNIFCFYCIQDFCMVRNRGGGSFAAIS